MGYFIDEKGLIYSGAGVLIIEDYKKNNKVIKCVILAQNRRSEEYSDFGGRFEKKHKHIQQTAYSELREESANLINVKSKHFSDYVNISSGNKLYRAYIIKINGIKRKMFQHNKRLLDERAYMYKIGKYKHRVPKYWRETNNIRHIPINNIDFDVLQTSGKHVINDVDGNRLILHDRVKKILHCGKDIIMNNINSAPIATKDDMFKIKSKTFRHGTLSFNI